MSDPMQPGQRLSSTDHQYQRVQVSGKAHLGDTYNFGRENRLGLLPFATNAPFNTAFLVGYRMEGADEIAWPSGPYELANWLTQLRSKVGSRAIVGGGPDGHMAEGIGRTHGGMEGEKDPALWLVGAGVQVWKILVEAVLYGSFRRHWKLNEVDYVI